MELRVLVSFRLFIFVLFHEFFYDFVKHIVKKSENHTICIYVYPVQFHDGLQNGNRANF